MLGNKPRWVVTQLRRLAETLAHELAKLEHRGERVTCGFCLHSIPWGDHHTSTASHIAVCRDLDACIERHRALEQEAA